MKSTNGQTAIREIVILDPNDYVTSNTIIAELVIRSPHGERRMPLQRTRKKGYMLT